MQEVARSRMAGHHAAGQVAGSRARRQETTQDKESKTKNMTKSNVAALNGKEKLKIKIKTVAFEKPLQITICVSRMRRRMMGASS